MRNVAKLIRRINNCKRIPFLLCHNAFLKVRVFSLGSSKVENAPVEGLFIGLVSCFNRSNLAQIPSECLFERPHNYCA
jgi:hypothetical protein